MEHINMKILVALHSVMDLGGIINHTEQLIGGLKDLGHTVHLKEFVWGMNAHAQRKTGDWKIGPSGIPHDQGKGWNFAKDDRIAYKTPGNMYQAKKLLEWYDMIIWTVPVPSKNKVNTQNYEWPELYDLPNRIKQVAFIHDGNSRQGVPHITHIQEHLAGVACVHHCALNSSDFLSIPRALILNPQENPVRDHWGWNEKHHGFVNMQTFKAWKHAHELVEAIAYMPPLRWKGINGEYREVAGQGIEYRYMKSEEKCKDAYFHNDGRRFWDAAIENGMHHHPYWNVDEVEQYLNQARVLVDPSWSNKYSQWGGHYNRVVVDAMIRGAVPVARFKGMGNDLFKAGEHYINIPAEASPEMYAEIILETGNMSSGTASYHQEAARELLPLFERATVAQRLIDLAHGELDDVIDPMENTFDVSEKAEDILFNHFGII